MIGLDTATTGISLSRCPPGVNFMRQRLIFAVSKRFHASKQRGLCLRVISQGLYPQYSRLCQDMKDKDRDQDRKTMIQVEDREQRHGGRFCVAKT